MSLRPICITGQTTGTTKHADTLQAFRGRSLASTLAPPYRTSLLSIIDKIAFERFLADGREIGSPDRRLKEGNCIVFRKRTPLGRAFLGLRSEYLF